MLGHPPCLCGPPTDGVPACLVPPLTLFPPCSHPARLQPDTLWVPSAAQLDHFNSQMGFQLEASFATPPPALPPSLPPLALRGSTAAGSSGNASGCAAPAHTPLPTVVQALFIGGEQAWPLAPGIAGLACAGQAQRLMHPGLITRKNGKTYRALP